VALKPVPPETEICAEDFAINASAKKQNRIQREIREKAIVVDVFICCYV
jgi:hypothetical protein